MWREKGSASCSRVTVWLPPADSSISDLASANFRGSKFARAELVQCLFRYADLRDCDFRESRLRGGEFSHAVLAGSRFGDCELLAADFRGANLCGARELTGKQLCLALTDDRTTLPNGSPGPYLRNSGAERPAIKSGA